MILEDRSGSDDPTTLTKNVFTFLGAISKRPEIAAAIPSYQPAVPQLYADVDKEKALQQQVDLTTIYTTMQTFMGGYLVNYFNRFGRQWQTYVEADGTSRTEHREHRSVLCTQRQRQPGSAQLSGQGQPHHGSRIHLPIQRIQCSTAQHHRRARIQFGSGSKGSRRSLQGDHAARRRLRLFRHVFPGAAGGKGRAVVGSVRSVAGLRLPDSRGSL